MKHPHPALPLIEGEGRVGVFRSFLRKRKKA
jgi:hypothetical protein